MPQPESTPEHLCAKIDRLDIEILDRIRQRAEVVQGLFESLRGNANAGEKLGRVADAADRIATVVQSFCSQQTSDSLSPQTYQAILRHLSSECLRSVDEIDVAFLGPEHSYSHLAALKYFGDGASFAPVASIPSVFDAVTSGQVTTGIVPIENSTDGRVVDTLGMFIHRDVKICGEVLLPVHHTLLSKTKRDKITEVHSKPQALSQCRTWLSTQLPNAKLVEVSSTAAAAKLASEQIGVAAVASIQAGRQYDLDVIQANIEDNPNNVTRFAVIGRCEPAASGNDKTSLLFQVNHQPGALADAMVLFKERDLNLTWIESFPAPGAASEYLFFVELTGHRDQPAVADAINALRKMTQRLEVLGSYPKADPVETSF